jgi:hypothetical protein
MFGAELEGSQDYKLHSRCIKIHACGLLYLIDRYIVGISLPGLRIRGYGSGMKSLILFEPLSVYLVSCLSGRQSREVRYSFLTEKAHRYVATMDLETLLLDYSLRNPPPVENLGKKRHKGNTIFKGYCKSSYQPRTGKLIVLTPGLLTYRSPWFLLDSY